jgi:hypothetical protein
MSTAISPEPFRDIGLVEAVGVGRGAFWRVVQWPDS